MTARKFLERSRNPDGEPLLAILGVKTRSYQSELAVQQSRRYMVIPLRSLG
jgi:hypothetical protein